MTFFHDLNKRLAALASKQDAKALTESATAVAAESKFSKLAKEISKNPKVTNPDAVAAAIGRKKYGQKAMTAKSIAGKKKANEGELGTAIGAGLGGAVGGIPGAALGGVAGHYLTKDDKKATKEGNTFTGALAKTPKGGKFKVGGKEFKDTSNLEEGTCPGCKCNPCECVEEGNTFTGALAKTPKGGKFKVGKKEFTDTSSIEEGFADMDAWLASREKEKGTGRFDKKKISTGTVYTRKPETFDEPEGEVSTEPKRRGRPAGPKKAPERVTKGAWKHKAGRVKAEEDIDTDGVMMTRPTNCSSESIEHGEQSEYNDEVGQTKDSLHTIVRHAKDLENALRSNENMPEWVQEKIGQIKGMMSSVTDYIISTHERDIEQHTGREGVTLEKAPPGAKAERMVKHIKKSLSKDGKLSDKDKAIAYATTWKAKKAGKVEEESTDKEDQRAEHAGKRVAKDIEHDEGNKAKGDNKAEKAGKKVTKDIEYDDKKDKKEKKVDETTVAGSVATAPATPKASKGGMQFGKGVYESLDRQFKQALTESIQVESTMSECGDEMGQGIVIKADGEDAAKLMALLKLAGLEGCPSCGRAPCGCESLEENSPDWPTDTETLDADPELRTYSGGLNGPKSTGQSTTPVLASQLRRQASMEESVKIERNLFNTWKNYKG